MNEQEQILTKLSKGLIHYIQLINYNSIKLTLNGEYIIQLFYPFHQTDIDNGFMTKMFVCMITPFIPYIYITSHIL